MSEQDTIDAGTKLQHQARSKGDLSYSYWTNTSVPANSDVQPKKLSGPDSVSTQQEAQVATTSGQHSASSWNKAGTFEERDVTEWAKQRLQGMLVGTSSEGVVITKCTSITGSANIWFIRGSKRSGFDLQIDLEWQHGGSSTDTGGPAGTIRLPSASPDDLDDLQLDISLSTASGDAAADQAVRNAAKTLQQPLQQLFKQFLAELRDM